MKRLIPILLLVATPLLAQTVTSSYFGLDFNSSNTSWPLFNQAPTPSWSGGVVRLHDSGTKLYDIFNGAATGSNCDPLAATPVTSGCNWTAFDKFAANALAHNAVLEYTFSKMPTSSYWSSYFPYTSSPSTTTAADDAFVAMVKAIRDHGGCTPTKQIGCISQWEIWNEPNNNGGTHSATNGSTPYWDGTIAQLVHLSRLVRDHVKTPARGGVDGVDPNSLVLGPGGAVQTNVGSSGISTTYSGTACDSTHPGGFSNGNLNVEAFTCLYLVTTGSGAGEGAGKDYIDAVTAHLYPASQTLSTMAEQPYTSRMAGVKTAMDLAGDTLCAHGVAPAAGVCDAFINTEWSWGTCSSPTTPRLGPSGCSVQLSGTGQTGSWRDDQAALLWKSYILGWHFGAMAQIWYGWDFQNGYGNLLCTGANATIGCALDATHTAYPYQQNAAWAFGAAQWMIGKTLTGCAATGSTWRCDFSGANGYSAVVTWNSGITGSPTTYNNVTQTRDIYGNITPVTGGSVTLTPNYYPVVIETIPVTGTAVPTVLVTQAFTDSHYEPLGTTSNAASAYLQKSANLSDLPDPAEAVRNLGLEARPLAIPAEWNGNPPAGQVLRTFIVPAYSTTALTVTIPANCSEFGANVTTAATANTAFTVKKNGTAICTLTVASGCTGTSCATAGTGGSQTTLTSNDVLTISGGGDATLAGVSFSISASATGGAL
jgi:hypothetical protein